MHVYGGTDVCYSLNKHIYKLIQQALDAPKDPLLEGFLNYQDIFHLRIYGFG